MWHYDLQLLISYNSCNCAEEIHLLYSDFQHNIYVMSRVDKRIVSTFLLNSKKRFCEISFDIISLTRFCGTSRHPGSVTFSSKNNGPIIEISKVPA